MLILAEPAGKARQRSSIAKEIWYCIDAKNFGCDVSVRPSVRPYRLWGRGRKVPRQPDREWRMPSFLGGKSRGAFGQPAFFLAGNRMTIVAFEKEVSLFDCSTVL